MKKHWLRGLLLGVSVAVLLVGGVALAASLDGSVSKRCLPCYDGEEIPPTDDAYLSVLTITGFNPAYELCARTTIDGQVHTDFCQPFVEEDPYTEVNFVFCEWPLFVTPGSVLVRDVNAANGPPDPLGEWNLRLWQVETGESVEMSWLVVSDISECPVEFVPEPGTIALLGTGLAGLAGYAALRWRTRE